MQNVLEHCVQDTITGALWRGDGRVTLVSGQHEPVLKGRVLHSGHLVLRYAIPFQGPRHLSVVPAIFVSEQGGMLYGLKAWRFMFQNYQLYPRAEVLGLQSDGEEVQVFMRELDLADTPRVLAYSAPTKTIPLATVQHILHDNNAKLPELAKSYLPTELKEN